MARSNMLGRWTSEYCAPVVATLVTGEVESICLKNGLLFHHLLSAFGHLDGIHVSIRSNNQLISVSDAQIRFERATEMKAKTSNVVEELLRTNFEELDITSVPASVSELRSSTPSSWNSRIEQLWSRSISFSEFEMLSHPAILLVVVSTSDRDVLTAMQELSSPVHLPPCMTSGQYEPDIHKVFLLLHDAHAAPSVDPTLLLRKLQTRFPPVHTKLLTINSLAPSSPNLHQPDMWSRYVAPLFCPELVPVSDPHEPIPINPVNGTPVFGSRLSMEDFMSLRDFCIELYHQEIIPQLERRILNLTKIVTDTRKGMKNVLKSFWRKPREEMPAIQRGPVKYRFDRIEAQILLLADTCFIIKDYENALSMYKLVRDDFRADKTLLHLTYASFMIALTYSITEPGRKDLLTQLEAMCQILPNITENVYVVAFFALMASEILLSAATRAPVEAAHFLLQVAAATVRFPLMSALLTERAAGVFLLAGQPRKFCLHEMLAGLKMYSCGARPSRHAIYCFAITLIFHDNGSWGSIKGKLAKYIADDWKTSGDQQQQRRALVLLLKVVSAALDSTSNICGRETSKDSVGVLRELTGQGPFGCVTVSNGWNVVPIHRLLTSELPTIYEEGSSTRHITICGLSAPFLDQKSFSLLYPINGFQYLLPFGVINSASLAAEDQLMRLETEKVWFQEVDKSENSHLCEKIVELEAEIRNFQCRLKPDIQVLYVPLNETLVISVLLSNKLPCELHMTCVRVETNAPDSFETSSISISLQPGEQREIQLSLIPLVSGTFNIQNICWDLSEFLTIRQPIRVNAQSIKGTRPAKFSRSEEIFPSFEVGPPYPLININFEGIPEEVLQGQLIQARIVLKNEGSADACAIDVKLSHPSFFFSSEKGSLESSFDAPNFCISTDTYLGSSCTLFELSPSCIIHPGESLNLSGWLRLTDVGPQAISLLVSYSAPNENGNLVGFGRSGHPRTSITTIQTQVVESLSLGAKMSCRPSLADDRICILDISNAIPQNSNTGSRQGVSHDDDIEVEAGNRQQLVEGELCVDAILIIGATTSFYKSSSEVKYKDVSILTAEAMTICLPFTFDGSSLLGAAEIDHTIKQFYELDPHLMPVVDKLLCRGFCADDFSRRLSAIRYDIALRELEESTAGPRTISQVRKDRTKELSEDKASVKTRLEVMNLRDLILHDRKHGKVTIVVAWQGRYKGVIRRGLHYMPGMSLFQYPFNPSPSNIFNPTELKPVPEIVQASIVHNSVARISPARQSCLVEVDIKLKSVFCENLTVTVETVDRKGAVSVSSIALSSPISATEGAAINTNKKTTVKGIRWERKTKYCNVALPPFAVKSVKFFANISKCGVFDLKRFRIIAHSATIGDSLISIPGQSIIEIIPE